MKVIDLFSGIGAVEMALKELKIPFETAAICEIDKNAIKIYERLHEKANNLGDITKVTELPECDYIHFSSPCTSFSQAAKSSGNQTGMQGKSGILIEVYRLFENYRDRNMLPKYFTFENVESLTTKFKDDWEYFLSFFDEIGYNIKWSILNARDFDCPQERKRVFAVGIRKDLNKDFEMPIGRLTEKRLKDIMLPRDEVGEDYYHPDIRAKDRHFRTTPVSNYDQVIETGFYFTEKSKTRHQTNRIYDPNGLAPTVTTVPQINFEVGTERLRRVHPHEVWRIMGFSDEDYEKIKDIKKSPIMKACGNSIALGPIKAILERLFKEGN